MERTTPIGPVTVLIDESAERALHEIASAAWGELQTEWGGLLFGALYETGGCRLIWVRSAVPGLGSGTPVSFNMKPRSYVLAHRLLAKDRQHSELSEVGFWHSHPNLGSQPSSVDVDYHLLTFPRPWSVSLIVDPFRPEGAAYVNAPAGIARVPAFSVRSKGPASVAARPLVRAWDPAEVRRALG